MGCFISCHGPLSRFEWKIPEEAVGVLTVEPVNGTIDPGEIQVSLALQSTYLAREVGYLVREVGY